MKIKQRTVMLSKNHPIWTLKLTDLLNPGFKVKVLLADLHTALDNMPWEIIDHSYKFYLKIIPPIIQAMSTNTSKPEFIKGSYLQLSKKYVASI